MILRKKPLDKINKFSTHKFLAPLYFFFRIVLFVLVLFSSISILSFKPFIALDNWVFILFISSDVSGIFNEYLINPLFAHFSISRNISPKFLVYILHKVSFFSSKK